MNDGIMFGKTLMRRETMKKHLFGLGAMLVGAGLMFVLMHGEVMADDPIYDSLPFVVDKEEKQTNAIKSVVDREGVPEPFVCSDLASGITGEVLHVDNGFHAVGMADGVSITETQTEESV